MRSAELHRLLRKQPLEPFALHVSDGARYEIHYPDQVLLTERSAHVGVVNGGWDKVADEVVTCSLVQVTRAVPLGRSQGS